MIELAGAAAADVGEHAVEDHSSVLVEIASVAEELAQHPPRLRHTEPDGVVDRACARIAVAGRRVAEE